MDTSAVVRKDLDLFGVVVKAGTAGISSWLPSLAQWHLAGTAGREGTAERRCTTEVSMCHKADRIAILGNTGLTLDKDARSSLKAHPTTRRSKVQSKSGLLCRHCWGAA